MFYERYLKLCEGKPQNGKKLSPSAAAELCGFNRGTVSVWKQKYEAGQDVQPKDEITDKICTFFGCSKTWLLGIEETKKAPTPEGERVYTAEAREAIEALYDAIEAGEITAEDIAWLRKFKALQGPLKEAAQNIINANEGK